MEFITAYGPKVKHDLHTGKETEVQQSFAKECDINHIMAKFQKTGLISHINPLAGISGDFSGVTDYRTAMEAVLDAQDAFMALPATTRAFFQNDPAEFLEFTSNPANGEKLVELGLATPRVAYPVPKGNGEGGNSPGASTPTNTGNVEKANTAQPAQVHT